ncbi:hypothetical protein AYI68_g4333 [Smittium mucronatum]|uniref:INO80 complex subunit B-like conserved region domain-containing protein n=1 Tax=Smittium mucronatum TaxID=133383 RepID=A0A1R0GXE1_9FUNG|nr:hypothetical protein AYI68_g4333 [Smittium mucronatum]
MSSSRLRNREIFSDSDASQDGNGSEGDILASGSVKYQSNPTDSSAITATTNSRKRRRVGSPARTELKNHNQTPEIRKIKLFFGNKIMSTMTDVSSQPEKDVSISDVSSDYSSKRAESMRRRRSLALAEESELSEPNSELELYASMDSSDGLQEFKAGNSQPGSRRVSRSKNSSQNASITGRRTKYHTFDSSSEADSFSDEAENQSTLNHGRSRSAVNDKNKTESFKKNKNPSASNHTFDSSISDISSDIAVDLDSGADLLQSNGEETSDYIVKSGRKMSSSSRKGRNSASIQTSLKSSLPSNKNRNSTNVNKLTKNNTSTKSKNSKTQKESTAQKNKDKESKRQKDKDAGSFGEEEDFFIDNEGTESLKIDGIDSEEVILDDSGSESTGSLSDIESNSVDFQKMTRRQRARFTNNADEKLMELPVESKKVGYTEEELALRRSEYTRRRKFQSMQRAEQLKNETISKLLNKQTVKGRNKLEEEESSTPSNSSTTIDPTILRWKLAADKPEKSEAAGHNKEESTQAEIHKPINLQKGLSFSLQLPEGVSVGDLFPSRGVLDTEKKLKAIEGCSYPGCTSLYKYKVVGKKEEQKTQDSSSEQTVKYACGLPHYKAIVQQGICG